MAQYGSIHPYPLSRIVDCSVGQAADEMENKLYFLPPPPQAALCRISKGVNKISWTEHN